MRFQKAVVALIQIDLLKTLSNIKMIHWMNSVNACTVSARHQPSVIATNCSRSKTPFNKAPFKIGTEVTSKF